MPILVIFSIVVLLFKLLGGGGGGGERIGVKARIGGFRAQLIPKVKLIILILQL